MPTTTTKHVTKLADAVERAWKGAPNRSVKPDPFTEVYRTRGGTVIVASSGTITDSGKPRDLMVVLPFPMGASRVIPLYIGANPDVMRALDAELARRGC